MSMWIVLVFGDMVVYDGFDDVVWSVCEFSVWFGFVY